LYNKEGPCPLFVETAAFGSILQLLKIRRLPQLYKSMLLSPSRPREATDSMPQSPRKK
jgi:hypothetical protein